MSGHRNPGGVLWRITALIFVVVLVLDGCVPASQTGSTQAGAEEIVIQRIAVVPFDSVIPEDPAVTFVRCPVSGTYYATFPSSGDPEEIIETLFYNRITSLAHLELIPTERVRGVYKSVRSSSFKRSPREIFVKVGSELNADGVVAGYVYRYRERAGATYGVKQPASVAFGIYLIRVSDGAIVWKGRFDKVQTSLMENVLDVSSFIRGKGRWMTAAQLSEAGIDAMVKTFPGYE